MKREHQGLVGVFLVIWCLGGCATNVPESTSTPTDQPQQKAVTTPSRTATPQPSTTKTPTNTPSPSLTPTSSPTPLPTKPILLQFGAFGGDGGSITDFYFGRDTPSLVIYTDGQTLIRKGNYHERRFEETTLSLSEMCSLLSHIQGTGFFNVESTGLLMERDPIYRFNETTEYSDGAPAYSIQVNGEPRKYVDIYSRYVDYLINEVRATYELLSAYHPPRTASYQPERVLLWIEKGRGQASDDLQPQPWPSELPSLGQLLGAQDKGQVMIEGEPIELILASFDNQLTDRLFTLDNTEYYVILRPLLPHETPERFSVYPYEAVPLESPVKCKS